MSENSKSWIIYDNGLAEINNPSAVPAQRPSLCHFWIGRHAVTLSSPPPTHLSLLCHLMSHWTHSLPQTLVGAAASLLVFISPPLSLGQSYAVRCCIVHLFHGSFTWSGQGQFWFRTDSFNIFLHQSHILVFTLHDFRDGTSVSWSTPQVKLSYYSSYTKYPAWMFLNYLDL